MPGPWALLALLIGSMGAWSAAGASPLTLRGGGPPRTLPTQPWLLEGLPPEFDPAGNIWETRSWRERILRHQQEKAARRQTERDAYGSVLYTYRESYLDDIADLQHLVPDQVKKRFAAAASTVAEHEGAEDAPSLQTEASPFGDEDGSAEGGVLGAGLDRDGEREADTTACGAR